jgi:hypothetical protein
MQYDMAISRGTGQFVGATGSFSGTVRGRALLVCSPDGRSSVTQVSRYEVDKFTQIETLSFC